MAGLFAKGTILLVGNEASPQVFTAIANARSYSGPTVSVTMVDTTTHSTEGNFREKAAVLVDSGKISFEVNYDPADPTLAPSTGLFNDLSNLTRKDFQLKFPPSDTGHTRANFSGYVVGHPFNFPVDNVITGSIEIDIDGQITFDTFTP